MKFLRVRSEIKWVMVFSCSLFLFLFMNTRDTEAQPLLQSSNLCLQAGCHSTSNWLDNNPPSKDVASRKAFPEYLPLNLSPSPGITPFYKISEAYLGSIHNVPAFDPSLNDNVKCVGCHVSIGTSHSKAGSLPGTATCTGCHNTTSFLATAHGGQSKLPGKFFDQLSKGAGAATTSISLFESPVKLLKSDQKGIVSKNQRIEECSVCHNYALQYPVYKKKITNGSMPDPQVGCSACHDAHIPAPSGAQIPMVSKLQVVRASGSNILEANVVDGREVTYRNLKPYKIDATGAQDVKNGTWARGTAYTNGNLAILSGTGTISDGTGTSDQFSFTGGGFEAKVQPHDTLFISGVATATANLPADATRAGQAVTVQATLDKAGFGIVSVISDTVLEIDPGVVATATVTYTKTAGGTGSLSVSVPFSGSFTFEMRNMNTNTETLCGSCHTQGKYKYTAWGKKQDKSMVDLSSTHNVNVLTQYRNSGHADITAPAFEEFSARPYGSSHVTTYPFDMSITGSGGVGSSRNRGNTTFALTQTPSAASAYLVTANNTTSVPLVNNYACFQCHNGFATVDYLLDRQGTASASVVWGDANPTCYTCHDPHEDGAGKNVRVPVKLSYNSRFVDATTNPRGGINKFLDGTDIPSNAGTGIICLFCHQGRESGLTVYRAIKAANATLDPYANPDTTISASGVSFINPHYLDSGSILWSKNAWEYSFGGTAQQYYNGIPAHQELNCSGCHMAEANESNTEGGHSFKPRVETCKQCHGQSTSSFEEIPAFGDYDGDGVVETAFEEIGTLGDPVLGDSGLFGQLKAALATQGIVYNPDSYPYFFTATGGTFRAWTTNTLSAAFNLTLFFKSGNCVPYHNVFYGAQILQDSLRALAVDTSAYDRGPTNRAATYYPGIVVNP